MVVWKCSSIYSEQMRKLVCMECHTVNLLPHAEAACLTLHSSAHSFMVSHLLCYIGMFQIDLFKNYYVVYHFHFPFWFVPATSSVKIAFCCLSSSFPFQRLEL